MSSKPVLFKPYKIVTKSLSKSQIRWGINRLGPDRVALCCYPVFIFSGGSPSLPKGYRTADGTGSTTTVAQPLAVAANASDSGFHRQGERL